MAYTLHDQRKQWLKTARQCIELAKNDRRYWHENKVAYWLNNAALARNVANSIQLEIIAMAWAKINLNSNY